jgi:branched-chain amino acid transport system substrate-binding protein
MKAKMLVIVSILALMSLVCTQGPAEAAQDDIVIGMLLAMSGQGISYGKWMSQGALLAAEEINQAGGINGRNIRIEIGDHKSGQAKAGVSEMSRLVNLYHTPAVLSSYSAPTLAVQPIAVERNVVLINGGGWSPKLINKKYLWNTRLTGDATAKAILKVAWDDGMRKICMIYRKDPSGIDTANSAREYWTGKGGKVLCEEKHDIETSNFSAQMAKIRVAQPDALVTFSYGKTLGIQIKQARDFGVKVPLYGIEFIPENVTVAGAAIEGYKFALDEFDVDSTEPNTAKFVKAYRAKYNEDPEFYGANYYEATYILAECMKVLASEGKPITGANIDAKIRQIRNFPSVYGGIMTLNLNGTVNKPIAVFVVRGGHRQLVARVSG